MEISFTNTVATRTLLGGEGMDLDMLPKSFYYGLNPDDHLITDEKKTIGVADGVGGCDRTSFGRKNMKMVSGSFYIPKAGGWNPRGDDAHFISDYSKTISVADGVGGCAKSGVDAGAYARQLMNNCVVAIDDEPEGYVDPLRVLNKAYSNTDAKGSSTACIITLHGQCLNVANVGDSGAMLIREGKVIFRTPIHRHDFNRPYQLGNSKISDRPESAMVFTVKVKPGDVIVVGTDGLFDNMFKNDITLLVEVGIEENMEPEQVAWAIAKHTYCISVDRKALTPIMEAAKKLKPGNVACRGGKKDDITVVVSYIVSSDSSCNIVVGLYIDILNLCKSIS